MKKLIINADDFGFDAETVEWTIKGFELGKITSATIMAGMQKEGLPGFNKVRRCQDVFFGKPGLLARLINKPMQKRLAGSFKMTDHFLMTAGHTADLKWFSKSLNTLPEGITEIGIHPGITEDWRRIDTEDCFATDLSGVELTNFNKI